MVFVSVVSITHSCKACEPNIIYKSIMHNSGNDSQLQPGFQRNYDKSGIIQI